MTTIAAIAGIAAFTALGLWAANRISEAAMHYGEDDE